MLKRIISFGLCLVMLAMIFAGCGKKVEQTTTTNPEDLPQTINLVGITDKNTTQEAIDLVEEALNKLTKTRYKTKIELTLVTAEQYMAEIDKRVEEANQNSIKLAAIAKFNTLAVKEANNAQKLLSESTGKKNNKWASQVTTVVASTMATGEIYSAEQTTVYENGKIETVYPAAQSPIDILMIDSKETYDKLDEKGYLLSVKKKLDEQFTKFRQYIYPTFFEQLEVITGDIKAIPNNNLLAEYTYVIIDKTIADAYNNGAGFNIDNVDNYADLSEFLAYVNENHKGYAPLATKPDALGIYQYMEGDFAIGTYYDPIYGFDAAEGTDFQIQNLFDIPQYQEHVALMKEYREAGYIPSVTPDKFAVNVIKGNAYVEKEYGDDYYVKVVQNPFVEPDAIFNGMFAVSAFTSSEDRALEIIEMFTTDPEAKNIFQYGIAFDGDNDDYANYELVEVEGESGKFIINRRKNNYIMDNRLTGNVYMGYPDTGLPFDAWDYYKTTNLDSGIAPFLHLYLEESAIDNILDSVVKRAAMTDALKELGIDYDKYVLAIDNPASPDRNGYIDAIRKANVEYFSKHIEQADKDNQLSVPVQLVTTNNSSEAVKELVKFMQSTEGQALLSKYGYVGVLQKTTAYAPVTTIGTAEIQILSNIGTSTKDYFNEFMEAMIAEFTEYYPSVTFVRPVYDPIKGYSDSIDAVNGANQIGITHNETISSSKVATKVAKSYLGIVLNRNHENFSQMWYENKLIEKVKADQYSNIISAMDLDKLVNEQVANLAGIEAKGDKTASSILASARKNAQNYYTNIDYLRVMVNEVLFKDENGNYETANVEKYAAMTDAQFMTNIYDYICEKYKVENNIDDAEYEKRVQNFMVSVLEYTSKEDNSVRYLISWDEFIAAEEGAKLYEEAAGQIKSLYEGELKKKNPFTYAVMSLDELMEDVYEIMYEEYLKNNNLNKKEFEAYIQNKYLNAVKSNAEDFKTYSKTSDEYKNIVSKLRKKFKAILIEEFSETAYKNGEKGISNEKVVSALYDHFLEEEIENYKRMAQIADVNVEDFLTSGEHYANYAQYISTLKTKYVYTLRTEYTDSQITAWSLAEAKANIFKILKEKGFYTNEMARYIGLSLSEYMLAESDAKEYRTYLSELATALAADITAKGGNVEELLQGDGAELEALAKEIVEEKYFFDKKSVTEELKSISSKYMGVGYPTTVEDMKAAAAELSENSFFNAVVNELQSMWNEKKAAMQN